MPRLDNLENIQETMIDEMMEIYSKYFQIAKESADAIRKTNDGLEIHKKDEVGLRDHLEQICEFTFSTIP